MATHDFSERSVLYKSFHCDRHASTTRPSHSKTKDTQTLWSWGNPNVVTVWPQNTPRGAGSGRGAASWLLTGEIFWKSTGTSEPGSCYGSLSFSTNYQLAALQTRTTSKSNMLWLDDSTGMTVEKNTAVGIMFSAAVSAKSCSICFLKSQLFEVETPSDPSMWPHVCHGLTQLLSCLAR